MMNRHVFGRSVSFCVLTLRVFFKSRLYRLSYIRGLHAILYVSPESVIFCKTLYSYYVIPNWSLLSCDIWITLVVTSEADSQLACLACSAVVGYLSSICCWGCSTPFCPSRSNELVSLGVWVLCIVSCNLRNEYYWILQSCRLHFILATTFRRI